MSAACFAHGRLGAGGGLLGKMEYAGAGGRRGPRVLDDLDDVLVVAGAAGSDHR